MPVPDLLPPLAYGPAPGVELIPYFQALVALLGAAFGAALLAPLSALLRRFRRTKGTGGAPLPESPGEAGHPGP